jgi:glutamate racemase
MKSEIDDPEPGPSTLGIFDSGVGGLSVLREVVRQFPHQDVLYLADSAHVPYGNRDIREVRAFSEAITAFLMGRGASLVIVACNTASAAALHYLRERFDLPLVGMEPAVKPAAEQTKSQQVGVIATPATFQGELFERLVERFAQDTTVHTQVCPGLVERVEAGLTDDPGTEALLREYLTPMLRAGIDALVLGCTHYPFLRPAIERIVGPGVTVIDPAPAVARQAGWRLARQGLLSEEGSARIRFYVSGDPGAFRTMIRKLTVPPGPVQAVHWHGNELKIQDGR